MDLRLKDAMIRRDVEAQLTARDPRHCPTCGPVCSCLERLAKLLIEDIPRVPGVFHEIVFAEGTVKVDGEER